MVPVGNVGMVSCFVCLARLVVFRSLTVVMSCALVMLGRFMVVIDVRHINLRQNSCRSILKPAFAICEAWMKQCLAASKARPLRPVALQQ